MKHIVNTITVATALFFGSVAVADTGGSCHFHGKVAAKEAVVHDCAQKKITALVAQSKIENSWKSAKLQKTEIVTIKNQKEWKLTFSNPTASDAAKKTLYTFFNLNGNFVAANFIGE